MNTNKNDGCFGWMLAFTGGSFLIIILVNFLVFVALILGAVWLFQHIHF